MAMTHSRFVFAFALMMLAQVLPAAPATTTAAAPLPPSQRVLAKTLAQPDEFFKSDEGNDRAMVNVMSLLKEVFDGGADYTFASDADRQHAREAFERGVQCILDCQIKVHGKLTAWCQQHDEVTLAPAGARSYELPSITGF